MELSVLISILETPRLRGKLTGAVSGLARDSRAVQPGDLFICVRGQVADGHAFARDALARGAVGVVVEEFLPLPPDVPQVQVLDTRDALARLSVHFYGNPSSQLRVVGVTGTNGKTIVTYLLDAILEQNGRRTGRVGTVGYKVGPHIRPAERTTPEALELQRMLREMVQSGCRYVVLEVSSHGLALNRVDGCDFDVAVFTNLGHDHLDFHHTRGDYLDAKVRLFAGLRPVRTPKGTKYAVLNADDAYWRIIADNTSCPIVTFGSTSRAQVRAEAVAVDGLTTRFKLVVDGSTVPVALQLPGRGNVSNALAAAAVGWVEGIPLERIASALGSVRDVPGRFDVIEDEGGRTVIVDFAHNPDALREVLDVARRTAAGRPVIAVFGAEGRKDRTKRPLMGRVAAELADYCIITSDNLYDEDPGSIAREVEGGVLAAGKSTSAYAIILDRRQAIEAALERASAGGVVVVAGKGHETEWIVGDAHIPFNDREVVERALAKIAPVR